MKTLSLRILPLLIIALLNACTSDAPNIKPDKTAVYHPVYPKQTVPTIPAPTRPVYPSKPYQYLIPPRVTVPQKYYSTSTHSGVFQKPTELEPAVEFWRKTYTAWNRSQVAIHDDQFLNVIYEVLVLPGFVDECLTTEQKEIIKNRRDFWREQLLQLEDKVRFKAPLNPNDRQLIAKLQSTGRDFNTVLMGADKRVRSQRGTRERFLKGLEISRNYDREFRKIFHDAGLPEDLAILPHVESSFQPDAKSSAGAVGMWQFTKAAAKTFMPGGDKVDRRLDPIASATGAARYLSFAYSRLGDWPTAITSYNHGVGGMKRAQNQVGHDFVSIIKTYDGPAFGFASRNYYAQFLAARDITSNPTQYIR